MQLPVGFEQLLFFTLVSAPRNPDIAFPPQLSSKRLCNLSYACGPTNIKLNTARNGDLCWLGTQRDDAFGINAGLNGKTIHSGERLAC